MRSFILFIFFCIFIAAAMVIAKDDMVQVDKMPAAIKMEQPAYPEAAKKEKVVCMVTVKAFIDESGKVTQAEIVDCDKLGYEFEQAALDAAYLSEFKPAEQDGKPVGVWVHYKVKFQLDEKKGKK